MELPIWIYHCDWGSSPEKRWVARAILEKGCYTAFAPAPVGDHTAFLQRVRAKAGRDCAFVGFDFPLGIPIRFARLIGVKEFKPFLMSLGEGRWSEFFHVCKHASEISPYRPFYPHKPGGTRHSHLVRGLGVAEIDNLRRKCERAYAGRKAACPLFWTLGANQVGKAAICGWRDVIVRALRGDQPPLLWPFDGSLNDLMEPGNMVVAETYPAEYYSWLFSKPLNGKGKQEVRTQAGGDMLRWADDAGVFLDAGLIEMIRQGFPNDDAFDATVGLFGMLEVALGRRLSGEPQDKATTAVEGWILGQKA